MDRPENRGKKMIEACHKGQASYGRKKGSGGAEVADSFVDYL